MNTAKSQPECTFSRALKLGEMGYKKGETPATPERIRTFADRGAALLTAGVA